MNIVKYIFDRYEEMLRIYMGRRNILAKSCYFIDWLLAMIVYGASVSDYFAYGFYEKRANGRRKYITYRKHKKIQKICNDKKNIEICRNKLKFNEYFSDCLGREWIDLEKTDYDAFKDFVIKYDCFFVKDVEGFRGIGTTKYNTRECDLPSLYSMLRGNIDAHFIVEEPLSQIGILSEFHPWSINTIRIVTVYDTISGEVHIMNARIRMGNHKNSVDNFHFAGIGANIDVASGVIDSVGYNVCNETFIQHPLTGKQIIGVRIPYWNECKNFIIACAKKIPKVRYIGWDIVIKDDAQFILLEANDNADHDFQQLHYKGLWKEYKSILKVIRKQ